jgi:hypothetical protein
MPSANWAVVVVIAGLCSVLSPSNAAVAAPDDAASQGDTCPTSVQPLIDAAAPGAVVTLPPCIARETLKIAKPLTLAGQPGSEIRGSDVWTNWTERDGVWVSADSVPAFKNDPNSDGRCGEPTNRCLRSEQVFFDGAPLYPTGDNQPPSSGQFALDAARHVLLADNPVGHALEVTTRRQWVITGSDNVTIQNLAMHAAAADALHGALSNDGFSNWTIHDSTLSDAHGANLSLHNGSHLQVLDNDISRGGDMGIHGTVLDDVLVQGNHIHDNATDQFSADWGAGGLKTTAAHNLVMDDNEVDFNLGAGLWCDNRCAGVTYSNNRVHDNATQGITFEISDGASIHDNEVWQNGSGKAVWAWGAGILINSSAHAEVSNNTVAWNYAGISVIAQQRPDLVAPTGIYVHDNKIVRRSVDGDFSQTYWQNLALAWLEDGVPALFDPGSNNRGANNRYWYDEPEGDAVRASWQDRQFQNLSDFAATPGDSGGSYLSSAEEQSVLVALAMPPAPGSL